MLVVAVSPSVRRPLAVGHLPQEGRESAHFFETMKRKETPMAGRLEGKVALITGGCSGIGLGTVERFVAEGAKVVAADLQDAKGEMLEKRFPSQVRYAHCDVLEENDIAAACALADDAFGGLDSIFNNAGVLALPGGGGRGVGKDVRLAWPRAGAGDEARPAADATARRRLGDQHRFGRGPAGRL